MKHICQFCRIEFEREKNGNKYKFCSHKCANSKRWTYNPERLAELAQQGVRVKAMAAEFDLKYESVRKALERHGLRRVWAMARYKKCREAA